MEIPKAFACLLFCLLLSCGSVSPEKAFEARQVAFKNATFDVVEVSNAAHLQFVSRNENGKPFQDFTELRNYFKSGRQKLLFATNGGIFEPGFSPTGLYVENGKELVPLNRKEASGNFYLQPNGVFYIGETEKNLILSTRAFSQKAPKVRQAIQSGPMLVIEGKIHPGFNESSPNRYIRSGVGIKEDGTIVFAISHQAVNLYTFGSLFRDELGCPNALYLDGAISEMYLPVLGRTDKGRPFGSIIAIVE